MKAKYNLFFTEETDVGFINPDTMRKEWYQCYYPKGSTLPVADIASGNERNIFAICTDGVIVVAQANTVRITHLNQK